MGTGRTTNKWSRFYLDGVDLSGYTRNFGPLKCEFVSEPIATNTDGVKNVLVDQSSLGVGTLNGMFDNSASGLHVVASASAGTKHVVMCPIGIRAAPAQGDPVYAGEFVQKDYAATPSTAYLFATVAFDNVSAIAQTTQYTNPWGDLLHAKGTEGSANSATGIDDNGGPSASGGFLCYHIFSVVGSGSMLAKVQGASANSSASFSDLAGATSTNIADTAVPTGGIVALGRTVAIPRYLRWQIVLSGITSANFALSFHRSPY